MTDECTYYRMTDPKAYGLRKNGFYYISDGTEWKADMEAVILGKLIGFDPYEPEDSPYRSGALWVLETIERVGKAEIPAELLKMFNGD